MKRRMLAVLIAIIIIPTALTAAPLLQFGGLVSYNRTVVEFTEEEEPWNINNFSFGADLRINPVKNLSLDIPVTIGFGKDAFSLAAIPTINANIPIAEIVDIAVGVGTQLDFTKAGDTWTLNGLPMDEAGGALAGSKLVYRAGLTVNLGILPLGIGINAVVPGSSGFGEGDIGGIFIPMWESTRISIVALLNLF